MITFVDSESALEAVLPRLLAVPELPLDIESDGLHAYRAGLCVIQALISSPAGGPEEVVIIDSLRLGDRGLEPLQQVLGASGPMKVIHDLAFDSRILAEHGLRLSQVFDTALAASFLGYPSTGLAALAQQLLGLSLSKKLQHHDWRRRPLLPDHIEYLAGDVRCIPGISRRLGDEVKAKGIERELAEETRYRLEGALAAGPEPRPAYVRIKQASKLKGRELAILRELAQVREVEARRLDVPPFKVLDNESLLSAARQAPSSEAELASIRGLAHGRARALHRELAAAVARGIAAGDVPQDERSQYFTAPPAPPREVLAARKAREARLSEWRKGEAKRRGIDAQAVLPGHCLQALADLSEASVESLGAVAGLGAFRVEALGPTLVSLVVGPG